jgi:hypothetical protein
MDDATPTTDQTALVIRHDFLDLWLRDACPPYASRRTRRAREIIAPPTPASEPQQEHPTCAQDAK